MSPMGQASHATALSEVRSANHSGAHSGANHVGEEDVQSRDDGAISPKAARSQISTAVSCEGARPAGSAAVAARSAGGDSAHSFADPEGENSSMPRPPNRQTQLAQPTTSLLSTAVRNHSPPPRMRAGSPELQRASSVVSHTEAGVGHNAYAGRAGTPASVYAQGRVLAAPTPARGTSPQASQAEGQNSGSEEGRHSRSSRRLAGGGHGERPGWAGGSTDNRAVHSHPAPMAPQLSVAPPPPQKSAPGVGNGAQAQHWGLHGGSSPGRGESPEVSQRTSGSKPPNSSGRGRPRSGRQSVRRRESLPPGNDHHQPDASTVGQDHQLAIPGLSPAVSSALPPAYHLGQPHLLNQGSVTKPLPAAHVPYQPLCTQGSTPAPSRPEIGGAEQIDTVSPNAADQGPLGGGENTAEVAGARHNSNDQELLGEDVQQAAEQASQQQGHSAGHQAAPDDQGQSPGVQASQRGGPGGGAQSGEVAEGPEISLSRQGVQLASGGRGPSQSRGSSHQQASPQGRQASAHAQINGQAFWEQQAAPVNGTWKPQDAAEDQDGQSLQAEEQAGNSVLGTLEDQDRGSNMEVGDRAGEGLGGGAHVQQPAMSQGSQQQAEADADGPGLQEPSYQGSVMPTPSANGEAAVAQALGPEAEHVASVVSGPAPSQLATKHDQLAGPEQASVKLPKASQNQKAQSNANGPGAAAQGSRQHPQPGRGRGSRSSAPGLGSHSSGAPSVSPHPSRMSPAPGPGASPGNHSTGSGDAAPVGNGHLPGSPPSSNGHLQNASLSGGFPAVATVGGEPEGFELVVQSQPPPAAAMEAPKPKPALTVVMQGGLVGPTTEPDDGAVGPLARGRQQQQQQGAQQGNSSGKSKAGTEAATSPSSTGRPRREAAKRRRTSTGFSPGQN